MILLYLFFFIFGAVMGSFLSAYTYRLVSKKSVLQGRSFCDKCKKKLNWYDNIPLLSYLFLRGKCRNCKKRISIRYPLLEMSTGLLFLGAFKKALICAKISESYSSINDLVCMWTSSNFIVGCLMIVILLLVLISVFVIDVEHMIIPDSLVFTSFLVFYIFSAFYFSEMLYVNLLAGFSAALFLLMLHLITKGRGMGLGDVKFAVLGGFILGPQFTVIWLFLSFFLGAILGLILMAIKKTKFGKQIPFGPFLVMAFIIVLFFGPEIYKYLNLPF